MSAARGSLTAAVAASALIFSLVVALVAVLAAGCDGPPVAIVEPLCEVPSEPGWEPSMPVNGWRYIIVHHSGTLAGSAALFDKYHREQMHFVNGLGYHFVIGNGTGSSDGEVEVGRRWKEQLVGAHVKGGDWNKVGIGICLVGDFMHQTPTDKQMASLVKLITFLQARCQIPSRMVLGHREARPGYTVCPGDNLSMPALRTILPAEPPVYRYVNGARNGHGNGNGNGNGSGSGDDAAVLIDPETGEPLQGLPPAVPGMSAPVRRKR